MIASTEMPYLGAIQGGTDLVSSKPEFDPEVPTAGNHLRFPALDRIAAEHRLDHDYAQKEYLVGGELRAWDGAMHPVYSPLCEETAEGPKPRLIGQTPLLDGATATWAADAAVIAHGGGLGPWPMMPAHERIRCVEAFLEKISEKQAEIIKLLMWEIGKTYADAAKEFDRSVQYVRDSIEALQEMKRKESEVALVDGVAARVSYSPRGVVLCMGPFNYPLNETFTTLMPALLMGNTTIVKPAKYGVLFWQPMLDAFRESFPPGVVNFIYGDGKEVITPIMTSGKVDALAFIGSSGVAEVLMKQHPSVIRLDVTLGLNAKNPAIVLPNADLDKAVSQIVAGALSYNGQRCTALKMIFVHRSVADEFVSKLSQAVEKLGIGMPWEPGVKITPMPEANKSAAMHQYVDDALAHGARITNHGGAQSHGSLFVPAVLYPVNNAMRLWSEEQFGPVVPVAPFDSLSEVLNWVSEAKFAQQASVFGRSTPEMLELIRQLSRLEARVNVNTQCQRGPDVLPFAARKEGGLGTLSVKDALLKFSVPLVLATQDNPEDREIISSVEL